MIYISIIGYIAAALGTFAYLPQVIKIWKTKQTRDISLPMYIALATGMVLWCIYGISLNEPPLYLANGIALTFTASTLYLKIRHG